MCQALSQLLGFKGTDVNVRALWERTSCWGKDRQWIRNQTDSCGITPSILGERKLTL